MSLRGSLDTFALPDVLALLASTGKDGELHVTGDASEGRVWLDGGRIVGAETATSMDVVASLVALLRLETGDFAFHGDRRAPEAGSPMEVADALEQAGARLAEWQEVEEILPSAASFLTLVAAAPGAVRLSKEQWAAVVAIGEGRTVQDLVADIDGDELAAWRLLAGLVEAGLVEVGEASQSLVAPVRRTELAQQLSSLEVAAIADAAAARADLDADEGDGEELPVEAPEIDAPAAPEAAEAPVPAPAPAVATDDPSDAVSRGTLLKFLSSVRS